MPALLVVLLLATGSGARAGQWEPGERLVAGPAEAEHGSRPEDPTRKHRLRAALEIGTVMGIYGGNYYTGDRAVNRVDWDYDVGGSLRARLVNGDAYRFDDNSFRINRNHAYAGLYYYQFARSNNLDAAESFLYTLAASSVWEYAIEYREPVSINDQIVTPFAGAVLGETLYQVARMLAREPNTRAEAFFAGLFDIPTAYHRWIDGVPAERRKEPGRAPAPGDRSYFDLQATVRLADAGPGDWPPPTLLGLDAGVVNVPDLAEPGRARLWLADTVSSRLKIEVPLNEDRASDFTVYAQSTLAALHHKDLERTEGGGLRGHTMFVGPGSAFTLLNAALSGPDDHADFMGLTHLVGPVLDAAWYRGATRLRFLLELYGDFAMVRSFAYGQFRESRALEQGRSLLDVYGYYFGLGYTGSARVELGRGPFEAGAGLRYGSHRSINGRPRSADQPNQDLDLRDTRGVTEAWLGYRVSDRVWLRLAVERTARDGSVEGFDPPAAGETRAFATLGYRLR